MTLQSIEVNPQPIQQIHATADAALEFGSKLGATMQLSSYKIDTTLGRSLPTEDVPKASALVVMMAENGWLTEADKEWCEANGISY